MIFGRISNMFWGLEDMRNAVTRFDYFISEQANIEAFAFESMIFPSMVTMVQTILRQSGFVSRLRWPVGVNGKHSSALFNSDSPRESHLNCLGPLVFPQSSDNPVWVRFCWLCIHRSCWMSIGKIPASLAWVCLQLGYPKFQYRLHHFFFPLNCNDLGYPFFDEPRYHIDIYWLCIYYIPINLTIKWLVDDDINSSFWPRKLTHWQYLVAISPIISRVSAVTSRNWGL